MSDELTRLSAARAAELIRGGELSPVELVGAYLRRVESLNPRLNAVVTLAPDVLKLARKAETAVARGESVGPLHGVPLTVKDTIEVRGVRTTRGSRVEAERVPTEDATAVARLRAAGAIIVGKTNCAELALEYTAENLSLRAHEQPARPLALAGRFERRVRGGGRGVSDGGEPGQRPRGLGSHTRALLRRRGPEADRGARARSRPRAARRGALRARREPRPARAQRRRP
jgi:aspartyl-tRNA(Asn)/glutamyl-tRNA(Gln) amidotransferase subunit A